MNLNHFTARMAEKPATDRMPLLFVGHGSPMNAIEDNAFTRAWRDIGQTLPRPQAILCISAHWFVDGTYVHAAPKPQTIHDYYGFPPELYQLSYPCPGSPQVAKDVREIVKKNPVALDFDWGLDHGTWVVMRHLFPEADVPVFQMSIDCTKPPEWHYELAGELQELRRRGVLIIGSGNIVHNLGLIQFDESAKPFDWALEFDQLIADRITERDHDAIVSYKHHGSAAHLSIPTPDHYWPLLYILALQEEDEAAQFFAEGIAFKSISMRSLVIQ